MKIVLAGMESGDSFKVASKINPPNILMTHMYLQKKSIGKVEELLSQAKQEGKYIIVDSGAFTFLNKYAILQKDRSMEEFKRQYKTENFDTNLNEYQTRLYTDPDFAQQEFEKEFNIYHTKWLRYLEVYYKYADMIAEVDLDNLVGMDEMWKLRKKYEQYHDKICYTPHLGLKRLGADESPEDKAQMMRLLEMNPNFIGIGRMDFRETQDIFNRYLSEFKKRNIKIHGWAQTSFDRMKNIPFYSVDSSTWLDGAKFGICFEFQPGWTAIQTHDSSASKKLRPQWKDECLKNGIDYYAFDNEGNDALNEWNCLQWKKFAEFWAKDLTKAYWISDEDKAIEVDKRREESGMNSLIVRETQAPSLSQDERNSITRICNSCNISDKCTKYVPNSTCAFNFTGLAENISGKDALKALLDMQLGRVSQAVMIERVQGANLDINVTKEIQTTAKLAKDIADIESGNSGDGASISLTAKGKQGVGILSTLFGNAKKEPEKDNSIKADYEVVDGK